MYDGTGTEVGEQLWRRRQGKWQKFTKRGGRGGIFMPAYILSILRSDVPHTIGTLCVVEGCWKAAREHGKGYGWCIGSYNANGKLEYVVDAVKRLRPRRVVILADNDNAGRAGAERLRQMLVAAGFTVTVEVQGEDAVVRARKGAAKLPAAPRQEKGPPSAEAAEPEPVLKGQRNTWIFESLCALRRHGADNDAIAGAADSLNMQCVPPLDPEELQSLVRSVCQYAPSTALNPAAPLDIARAYVQDQHHHPEHDLLTYCQSTFRRWDGIAYRDVDSATLRAWLYAWLERQTRFNRRGEPIPFAPKRVDVDNVLDALRAVLHIPGTPPQWLGKKTDIDAKDLIVARNGIYALSPAPDGLVRVGDSTPALLATTALDFDVDLNAPRPMRWVQFLHELFPNDQQSIQTLQEFAGYCLTADTSLHKALFLVGPKRSGRGTYSRVLKKLLGEANCASLLLNNLAGTFGLTPLIGKRLAIVGDARLSRRVDVSGIAEALLAITGNDSPGINIKYQPEPIPLVPAPKIMLLSNELPRFEDSSGALASRFIVVRFTESFFGREDIHLEDKLNAELPGILLWAVEGWKRLARQEKFTQPESSRAVARELEDLGSPVGAFVRECCVTGPTCSVAVDVLYSAWRAWSTRAGWDHVSTSQVFARDLHAVLPDLRMMQPRTKAGRQRVYVGIGLRATACQTMAKTPGK